MNSGPASGMGDYSRWVSVASGYIHCIYDVEGRQVRSLYARPADRYGRGGGPGAPVCYRSRYSTKPGRVPVPRNSRTTCLSIYDLYGARVCYTPLAVPVPATVPDPVNLDPGTPTTIPQVTTTDYFEEGTPEPILDQSSVPGEEPLPILDAYPPQEPVVMVEEEPSGGLDQKKLVIGGIIAAVVIGGIVVAATMRKK